jgi:hypothetical protein
MLGKNVVIGQCYRAKVSGQIQTVRITGKYERFVGLKYKGLDAWTAINMATGREVKILSAQRLRRPA